MLIFRGGALGALVLVLAGLFAGPPAARAQPAEGAAITADLKLGDDGLLEVAETVRVPPGGQFHMVLPLRIAQGDNGQRRFSVTGVSATGAGTAKVEGDRFTIDAQPGESSFTYTVHGVVSEAPGTQLFKWTGVLNADVSSIDASVISPSFRMGIADCTIGPPGQAKKCNDVRVEPDGVMFLSQSGLHRGDVLDVTLQLPPGTVPANADIRDGSDSGAFGFTAPVLAAFGVLLTALAACGGYVAWSRRQDAAALAGREAVEPLQRTADRVEFASPEGALPGEVGVLLDGHADAPDLAATVVDLAVRRYIRIAAISDSDWRIIRVNPADEQLRDYEKQVYRTLLPDGTDAVTVTELRGRPIGEPARAALLRDAVERGVLIDRTRRGLLFWLGAALVTVGITTTVALAISGGHALVGVAIALGGGAALLLPRYLPARTAAGRELVGKVRALQRGLDELRPDRIPPGDRELVFSRALPFTIIGGRADNWIRVFRDIDPSADRRPGLYWFGGFERDRNLHRFAGHFPYFITALEGLFA
ncbi:DUF2207 domain-containing protein [Nocardia sp. CDC159]|uniref:DUF2207 domain-containing protein n=1 Tax=Nocardia pulmonis TaxID=2951408 RepID=A0A9X2E6X7_9NOCA|nr:MULTISPECIES: DUF2207 domain-containing protein [Nocardia]MCM6772633.1 DUF2207 domain-containing protein [Nocardia pulmonis]MCM6786064.1 DUF2207 domain-containing protein [Nocardia sp. CDC159]